MLRKNNTKEDKENDVAIGATTAYTGSIGSLNTNVIDEKSEIRNQLIKNYKIFSHQYIHKLMEILIT